MSVLVIGGDEITPIKAVLENLGVNNITHWDARKKASSCKKAIPYKTECVIMLTNFLNHNAMKHYKIEAKKRNIPIVCAKRSVSCIFSEYSKVFGNVKS